MQDCSIIPSSVDVVLKCAPSHSFRCQAAANSLDIDTEKKLTHHLHIDGIHLPQDWNIGLVCGASGSGKTTLALHLFGQDIFQCDIDEERPIIEQFPSKYTYDQCAAMLNGIGLTSVPCWIRPYKTLSNGQKARAMAAYLMAQERDIVVLDEWTSVVDRTVAKAMSLCVHKYAKRANKRIILLSCHYDIIEWVQPDWLIDCNKQQFFLPQSNDFFFQPRDKLLFSVRECDGSTWRYFSKYHYLSAELPFGKVYYYGLYHNGEQIGFQCFANYVPHRTGQKWIYHSNRTVVHPDYCGLGLGMKLIDEASKLFLKKMGDIKLMAKFSAEPTYRAMIKDKNWKYLGTKRLMGKMNVGGNMIRRAGFREKGIKTYHFEWRNYGTI